MQVDVDTNRPDRTTRKPPHTEAERATLAARLEATCPPGITVTTWINEQHAELTRLTKGPRSWAWAELAEVLNLTRIRYRAGKPRTDGHLSTGRWTEKLLKSVIQKARTAEQIRVATRMPRTIEEVARAAASAVLAELGAQGVIVAGQVALTGREAVRQLAASPASPPPPRPQASAAPVHEVSKVALPDLGHQGPLAQAVADQAARDDRVLARIRERRRRQATGTPGSDQE